MKNRIDTKYFIPEGLDKDSVVVGGGGFVGEWDYYIYSTYGCHLYSFEPCPENYGVLDKLLGGYKKVTLIKQALWDTDGLMSL